MSEQQTPTLITVAILREALANIPPGLDQALVLCGGKPAHTLTLNLSSPDREPKLDIKFYTLGDL